MNTGDATLRAGDEPLLASHLVSPRLLYTHHGIYVGNGRVIHYAGFSRGLRRGPVEETSLERFAHGHEVRIRRDARLFYHSEIITRARSRLGESSYRVLSNNCEHFCAWVMRNERSSPQVDWLRVVPELFIVALRACHQRLLRHQRAMQAESRS